MRAQIRMAAEGLDGLLLTTEPEIRYFSGFLTRFWESPTRPWFLLIPATGAPIAVIPEIGADCMARGYVEDIRTWASPNPMDEGLSLLSATIREQLGPAPRLGLPMGAESYLRMALSDYARLQALLPEAAWVDCTAIIRALRMVKSAREIEKIAYICDLVSGVFENLPNFVTRGMSEAEIFRRFKIACLEAGADDVIYLVGGAAPGGVGDIISPPSERATADGDILMLDTGAVFDGYFCDFDRNYAFGTVDQAAHDAYAIAFEATEAGFATAKPGATCAQVFQAMADVISAAGRAEGGVGRMGHGLGMQLTEWPSNAAWDDTVIEPGMVLTLEPGLAIGPGRVMVHEENIIIHEGGADYLTRRAPVKMPQIG
jgi:Xaa-Pro aminopeptidase